MYRFSQNHHIIYSSRYRISCLLTNKISACANVVRYTDIFCNTVDCRFELALEVQRWTRASSECLPGGQKIIVTPLELTTADLYGESKSFSSNNAFTWLSDQVHSRRRYWVINPKWSMGIEPSIQGSGSVWFGRSYSSSSARFVKTSSIRSVVSIRHICDRGTDTRRQHIPR